MENETTNNNNEMNENNKKIEVEEKTSNGGYIKKILTGIGAAIALGVGGKIIYDKSKEDKEDDKKSDKNEDDKESDKDEDDKESDKEDDKESDKEKDKKDNKEEDSTLKYQGTDDKDSFILKLKKKLSLKPKVVYEEIDNRANSETTKEDDDKERVESFICPINKKIMEDPVITPYGTTYERSAILNWIKKNKTDYINNKVLTEDMLVTDYLLKIAIKEYNKSIKL